MAQAWRPDGGLSPQIGIFCLTKGGVLRITEINWRRYAHGGMPSWGSRLGLRLLCP